MTDAQILVATDKKTAQIRVVGRATLTCSQSMREFCLNMLGNGIDKLVIELSECSAMDSTFMGILAMVGLRAREKHMELELANANDRVIGLLSGLGLKQLFVFSETEGEAVDWLALCQTVSGDAPAAAEQAQTALDAHETLMDVDPENVPKFKDVVEYLRMDLKKLDALEGNETDEESKA